nr:glycosyltransferase [Demequina sp. NBRC 110051]
MPPVSHIALRPAIPKTAQPSVVFLGGWRGRKRGERAYRAVQQASSQLGRDITMTVIGNQADAANWPADVRFRSGLTDAEVLDVIAESWLLLAPSSYEGFGIPVFESLALGVPAVATSNPGSDYLRREVAGDDAALRIVDDEDLPAAVCAAIEYNARVPADVQARVSARVAEVTKRSSADYLVSEVYRSLFAG